jgi:hypothetical protein
METQVKVCDRHKNVAGSNQLMGSQPSTLDNWISNSNTYIYKNPARITQRDHQEWHQYIKKLSKVS